MKLAYLINTTSSYEEIVCIINTLIKQDDHVFIMINDNGVRDKISFTYADDKRVHISHKQEYAQEGDLSLARGTMLQICDALATDEFDYFINLTDQMIPIKTRTEIISLLTSNNNADYVHYSNLNETEIKKEREKYYFFTNLINFPTSKLSRLVSKGIANILKLFNKKHKLTDTYYLGSPWFMLSNKTAKVLAEHFDYISEHYKFTLYPEEMYIQMMIKKYHLDNNIINNDYRITGEKGYWIPCEPIKEINNDLLNNCDCLFAGKISGDNELFEKYLKNYNK